MKVHKGFAAPLAVLAMGTSMALGFVTSPIAPAGTAHASGDTVTVELPRCEEEDGSDVDRLCAWIDPDTGNVFINPDPADGYSWDEGSYVGGYN